MVVFCILFQRYDNEALPKIDELENIQTKLNARLKGNQLIIHILILIIYITMN